MVWKSKDVRRLESTYILRAFFVFIVFPVLKTNFIKYKIIRQSLK